MDTIIIILGILFIGFIWGFGLWLLAKWSGDDKV